MDKSKKKNVSKAQGLVTAETDSVLEIQMSRGLAYKNQAKKIHLKF